MNVSEEWAEWHLTPRGWERGSRQIDGSEGRVRVIRPADAVATYRYTDDLDVSNLNSVDEPTYTPSTGCRAVWLSDDKDAVKLLRDAFGPPPKRLS